MSIPLTRRQALASLGLGAAALAGGAMESGCGLLGRRPNVVLFVADDLGSVDLRCYGSKDLLTPHIDNLAHGGVRFTQFYVTAPACTPVAHGHTHRTATSAGPQVRVRRQPGRNHHRGDAESCRLSHGLHRQVASGV